MPANRVSTVRVAKRQAQQEKALDLRRAGWSLERIGAKLGVTRQRAHQIVGDALASSRAQITAHVDEIRAEELSRLDGMLDKLYPKAARGDLAAADRVLKIAERRARLLGLDAPVRTALQGGGDDTPAINVAAKVAIYIPSNGRDG